MGRNRSPHRARQLRMALLGRKQRPDEPTQCENCLVTALHKKVLRPKTVLRRSKRKLADSDHIREKRIDPPELLECSCWGPVSPSSAVVNLVKHDEWPSSAWFMRRGWVLALIVSGLDPPPAPDEDRSRSARVP